MNICQKINCPFANISPEPPRSSGCTRYSVSNCCHLNREFPLRANQYWLYADDDKMIPELKQANDIFIAQDERSQTMIELRDW